MEAIAGPVIGSVVGGLFGSEGGGGQQQSQSREPWAAAAPWLRKQLEDGERLQGYYQQNPFNPQQQVGYQNLLSGYDNYSQNIAPGLMSLANHFIGNGYQRQGGSGSGLAGTNPYARASVGAVSQGIPQGGAATPFIQPLQMQYGTVDWNAQNPYRNELKPAPAPAQTNGNQGGQQSFEDWLRINNPLAYQEMDSNRRYGQGGS